MPKQANRMTTNVDGCILPPGSNIDGPADGYLSQVCMTNHFQVASKRPIENQWVLSSAVDSENGWNGIVGAKV
ncbi:hypothetical protein SDC9_95186 [bioreactor metagenome]|uniref:Uncharacterized protein n=1 Tax=bioreactor metagenome TaxID=1076179 RepID=A0A645A851_9ZZZZ